MTPVLAVSVSSSITSALTTVANFVPKLVLFLVILVIGWIVAKVLRNVVGRLLARVGFDRVGERAGINRYLGKYTASTFVALLVYGAILLFALQLGFGAFGPNPVSNLISGVINFLPKLFVAIVIVIVAAAIARVVKDVISNALSTMPWGNALGRVAQAFIIAMGAIAALNQIHVASSVIEPVFIAVLAIIVGVAVVGLGGGLIAPMRNRWERMLTRAESEAGTMQIRSRSAQHDVQRSAAPVEPTGPQHTATAPGAGAAPTDPQYGQPPQQ
ncbi:hypothetical protein Athai_68220 [Actinocatenispora thailandica]|uniref:Uncharacterized protein n=1 Tax=Actinocatenispora thailandica TaxID=227318 RepID=A0A7R7I187_9ACTN|nr:hypothetical protein [Actinocatenispora thailandica]BCJ39319.1 hypothetical protein Athai_68220 [Actinocatenispora thailandica]